MNKIKVLISILKHFNSEELDKYLTFLVINTLNLLGTGTLGAILRAIIMKKLGFRIGDGAVIKNNVIFPDKKSLITIGKGTYINKNVIFTAGEITLGNNCQIGHNTIFCSSYHELETDFKKLRPLLSRPIEVEDFVWIGCNVTVLPGIKIGRGAVIGAGAIVTKDIPENSLAVGNPARVIRTINQNAEP